MIIDTLSCGVPLAGDLTTPRPSEELPRLPPGELVLKPFTLSQNPTVRVRD
jgi:hypothetical protein